MIEEASLEFRLREIDGTRNYLFDKIKDNDLTSEHFIILTSTVTGCVSISAFASLVAIFVGIMSCAVGIKIFPISAGIKK